MGREGPVRGPDPLPEAGRHCPGAGVNRWFFENTFRVNSMNRLPQLALFDPAPLGPYQCPDLVVVVSALSTLRSRLRWYRQRFLPIPVAGISNKPSSPRPAAVLQTSKYFALAPALSRPTGEGGLADANLVACVLAQSGSFKTTSCITACVHDRRACPITYGVRELPLSRPTGEGQGEGPGESLPHPVSRVNRFL
jgi:hypothetical protein